MTLDEFEQLVFEVADRSPICEVPVVRSLTPTTENIRVTLTVGGFVDAFCNEEAGTMAFALIKEDRRIFGADNTGGWHLHPFEKPEEHQLLSNEMSFAEFVAAVEKRYSDPKEF